MNVIPFFSFQDAKSDEFTEGHLNEMVRPHSGSLLAFRPNT